MNRTLLTIVILLSLCLTASAKSRRPLAKRYIFRYYLCDKASTPYALSQPEKFLSERSLSRRQRQHIAVDSTDLPVSPAYVKRFRTKGSTVLGTSRWLNTVTVSSADSMTLVTLAELPFVLRAQCVYVAPDSIDDDGPVTWNVHNDFHHWDSVANDPYGLARQQAEMLGGVRMHEQGFTGEGMLIAVIDGGFQNYDRIPALATARILGTHDFVDQAYNTLSDDKARHKSGFHAIDHGTRVLSAMAAYAPEVMIGTAYGAQFYLLRSEDNATEQPVEEDYWVMAAEYADSIGADVMNSSLGYHEYDKPMASYQLRNLNGKTAYISQAASMVAAKGMILCNSAGNSGMGKWKKIGVPADAHDILAVGAVDGDGELASFSSIGPSQDGRVKPDVVARGSRTTLISGRGTLTHDMGTSFASPVMCGMVACLWQALPDKTAYELMDIVRQSGDRAAEPDNIFGHGLPNIWKAYQSAASR